MKAATLAAVLVSAFLAAAGQILLKLGSTGRETPLEFANLVNFGGLGCYIVGLFLWMYSLSKLPLSSVYPFTFVTFVLVGLGSAIILGDVPSAQKLVGWLVTIFGVGIVALAT